MFGLAYGDALGAPTEFLTVAAIEERFGPGGPKDLTGAPARVTDDTQLAIAVGWALRTVSEAAENRPGRRLSPQTLEPELRKRFVAWLVSPDNNRAPGNTCLRGCESLRQGLPWQRASIIGSKGCGANMRVTPVGLLPGLDLADLAGAAQLQSAMTHGHPTALAASELTAYATRLLRDGTPLAQSPEALRQRCADRRRTYDERWLGDLWRRSHDADPVSFIARGWDECAAALDGLTAALRHPDRQADPCQATGQGWIAEEALATALYCALLFPDDPVAALSRAATSGGDSDSIACLAGAFLGAVHGMPVWPAIWLDRIEYANQLAALGATWD
ncbi:MAG: ADP-ribosylglycohydrolase family protein [Dactylosporangium sp.]|nr:ADP-ribosylglycohydrolase family protein [Dactylosporangium sp.]NNJ59451.1 ADP-ribosylglycohydrolase family protein [Dactylosporangium sp.]